MNYTPRFKPPSRFTALYAVVLAGAVVLFTTVDPLHAPLLVLVAAFFTVGFLGFGVVRLVVRLIAGKRPAYKEVLISLVVTAVPLLLLVLQSIGQLTLRDLLTITGLCIVGYVYATKFSLKSH